ncbi:MAG: hypothetical protein QOG21_1134 [Actinomycetota bacterium]|jgi:hypothetical protein|nr:hypothetical protein [Actinomycetota bacterium]
MNPTVGVIQESFDLYKKHFAHLFLVAFVIYAGIAILTAIATAIGGGAALFVASILSIIGLFLVQAALVEAVSDIRDGRVDMTLGETFSRGASRLGPVAGAGILAGIGIAIGLVLLIIPGLILLTWWSVIVPVIVLEGVGVLASFSRSRNLVRGHDFQVFLVIVLELLVLFLVGIVLSLILAALPSGVQSFVSNIVSGSLTGPFSALITTLLYFRLKEAKEGLGGMPPTQIS